MNYRNVNQYVREIQLLRERVESFEQYPFSLAAIHHLEVLTFQSSVTFIIGENGTGKSTLLEAIAVAWGFNPEGGSINFNFSTRPSHSILHQYLKLVKGMKRPRTGFFLRSESFFNIATEIEKLDEGPGGPPIINSYGYKSLHDQSHGESFVTLLMNRFTGEGLYILDEPEAALSPMSQMAILTRIHELVQKGSQFIIATHSPILMAYPQAQIILLADGQTKTVPYTQTEHYQTTKSFLNNPERALTHLLND